MARRKPRLRPIPPIGIATSYAAKLRAWLGAFNDHALDLILAAWEHDHPQARTDAPAITSSKVSKVLAGLQLDLADRFDPETQLSRDIRVLAVRVAKQNQIEFQRVVGIPTTDLGLGAQVAAFSSSNVGLIKSLATNQLVEIQGLLDAADKGATRVEDLRAQIKDRFSVTESKADLLARDQVLKLNGQITQVRQQNAGITSYIWRTSGDERVRESHQELDGTVQQWLAPPVVDETTGRTAHPGGDYQCRCTADPVLDELDGDPATE